MLLIPVCYLEACKALREYDSYSSSKDIQVNWSFQDQSLKSASFGKLMCEIVKMWNTKQEVR